MNSAAPGVVPMTKSAMPQDVSEIARLAAACKRCFEQRDFVSSAKHADQVLSIWSKTPPAKRNEIRKPAWTGLGFGCLACLKLGDIGRGIEFFEQVLRVKEINWEIGIRLANQLARMNETKKLEPVLEMLRQWAPRNPKHEQQLDTLLTSIGRRKPAKAAVRPVSALPHEGAHLSRTIWNDVSTLSVRALGRTVFSPSSGGYTIVINPKSACSTLKFNLWREEYATGATPWRPPGMRGGIHRKNNTPIQKVPLAEMERALFEKPVFSIVRNPYTRVLSAYLDKIAGEKKEKRHLLLSMGYAQNIPVTFAEFVDFICSQDSREMDAHYAPQIFLMQADYVAYAKIGSVETIDESIAQIVSLAYGRPPASKADFRPHRQGASSLVAQYYTDEIAAKVYAKFRGDFERFGYSPERSESHLPPRNLKSAAQVGHAHGATVLRPMLRAAVAEQDKNYTAAFDVLSAVTVDDPEVSAARARLLLRLQRPGEALGMLENVVARVGTVSQYRLLLAECLMDLRRGKEAVNAAESAASISLSEPTLRRVVQVLVRARERTKAKACREKLAAVEQFYFGKPPALRRPRASAAVARSVETAAAL